MLPPEPPCRYDSALDIQTRFNDFDAFAHINNISYLQYFDLGKEHFFNTIMGGIFSPRELSAVLVNVNIQFYAPTAAHEPLQVLTGLLKLGENSIHLDQRIVNPQTGQVKTTCVAILAGFDVDTQTAGPIPERLRAELSKLLEK